MTPLLLLAEKVEGLEGGNFALDLEIAYARHLPIGFLAKPYTASVDAALSLVPKGVRWRLGHDEDVAGVFMAQCSYSWSDTRSGFVVAYSRSAACALCASALRARAAMEAGE